MQFATLPALILFTLSQFSVKVAAQDSGYWATCNNITWFYGQYNSAGQVVITGNCEEESGIYNVAVGINIDECFGNNNGNLVGQLK